MFQPQLLTDREHVPVVLKCGQRGGKCAAGAHCALRVDADRLLERGASRAGRMAVYPGRDNDNSVAKPLTCG